MTPTRIPMSEAQLQATVIDMAHLFGWLVHHDRPARRRDGSWQTPVQGDSGFPDLILARQGTVLAVELKAVNGRLSAAQQAWVRELDGGPVRMLVWRPDDLRDGTVEQTLRTPEVVKQPPPPAA